MEETFTDLNLLELKDRHPAEVVTQIFTKPQEGLNGADWEWWLTDRSRTQWLGLRLQAKVLDLATDEFKHLHYRHGRAYQATKLQNTSRRLGLIPLYCLYLQSERGVHFPAHCGSYAHASESYGCSLMPVRAVKRLRRAGGRKSLLDITNSCAPWHCLVCCEGHGGSTLPERAWRYLQAALEIQPSRNAGDNGPQMGPRRNPPPYVAAILERTLQEPPDKGLRGIVIVTEPQRSNERRG